MVSLADGNRIAFVHCVITLQKDFRSWHLKMPSLTELNAATVQCIYEAVKEILRVEAAASTLCSWLKPHPFLERTESEVFILVQHVAEMCA